MTLEKRKLKLIEKIIQLEDKAIISQMEALAFSTSDFWETLSEDD